MTHLKLELTTGSRENVNLAIISKLYELALAGLDLTSDIKGWIHSEYAYRSHVEYLTNLFNQLNIDVDNYPIEFKDPNMLAALLAIPIGSDGMITEALAAVATFSNKQFLNNTSITSFDEFRYFTKPNLSVPGYSFNGCTNLVDITFPLNLTQIGDYAFSRCIELKSLDFSNTSLTTIGKNAFSSCTKLQNVNLPNTLTHLGEYIFDGDSLLSSINLSSILTLDNATFKNCTSLSIPASDISHITSFGYTVFLNTKIYGALSFDNATCSNGDNAFRLCTELTSADLSNLRMTGSYTDLFESCTKLQSVTIDISKIPGISNEMFLNCGALTNLNIKENGTVRPAVLNDFGNNIGSSGFGNCANLSMFDSPVYSNATGFIENPVVLDVMKDGSGDKLQRRSQLILGGCTLKQLYLPKLTIPSRNTSCRNYYYCNGFLSGWKTMKCPLIYFKDLNEIYSGTFSGIRTLALVIDNSNPPIAYNWNKNVSVTSGEKFKDAAFAELYGIDNVDYTIYVPDSAIETYKAADVWSSQASHIKGISELTRYATVADWEAAGSPAIGLIEEYMN